MYIHKQSFFDTDGYPHDILITFETRRCYRVTVDNEFYSTAETKGQAFDEVVDIIKYNNWKSIRPI